MTARDVLAEIQTRADAADPAPWKRAQPNSLYLMAPADESGSYFGKTMPRAWSVPVTDEAWELAAANARFIAAARTDVPRLVKALTDVLDAIDARINDGTITTLTVRHAITEALAGES